jgi:Fur family zinc uptake transcriptional regulator
MVAGANVIRYNVSLSRREELRMTPADSIRAFGQHEHDHSVCVASALSTAERLCAETGARLTETRRRVLELIWWHRMPVGAYQILDELAAERGRVAPPTVYRALDFLLERGLIHRIESLSAYVGCPEPGRPHAGFFLICRACGACAELHDARIDAALGEGAQRLDFRIERKMVELRGLCPACAGEGGAGLAN